MVLVIHCIVTVNHAFQPDSHIGTVAEHRAPTRVPFDVANVLRLVKVNSHLVLTILLVETLAIGLVMRRFKPAVGCVDRVEDCIKPSKLQSMYVSFKARQ